MKITRIICLSFILLFFSSRLQAEPENKPDNYTFEISFGNALLFEDSSYAGSDQIIHKKVLPVSSFLFLVEWRVMDNLLIGANWTVPMTTQKRSEGNIVYEKFVAPSYGIGPAYIPFTLGSSFHFEPQLGVFLSRTYHSESSKGDITFPLFFLRLHLASKSGFGLYAGVAQAAAKNTTAFIYGIGQRF
jgi:hypothetical protein